MNTTWILNTAIPAFVLYGEYFAGRQFWINPGVYDLTTNTNVHHEINYIEISALDLEQAKQFYSAAFGWRFNEYGPDYVGICKQQSDGEYGGICREEKIVTGGPLVILFSRDLESSLTSVTSAGGKITKEIFSFPGGSRFHFCDPSGNELAVWSTATPSNHDQ